MNTKITDKTRLDEIIMSHIDDQSLFVQGQSSYHVISVRDFKPYEQPSTCNIRHALSYSGRGRCWED